MKYSISLLVAAILYGSLVACSERPETQPAEPYVFQTGYFCDELVKDFGAGEIPQSLSGKWSIASSYGIEITPAGSIQYESYGIVPTVDLSTFRGRLEVGESAVNFLGLLRHAENSPADLRYTTVKCSSKLTQFGASITILFDNDKPDSFLSIHRDVRFRVEPRCLVWALARKEPRVCSRDEIGYPLR